MKWSDFVVEEDLARLQKYHLERTKEGNPPPTQYECRILNKKGEELNLIVNIGLFGKERIVSLTDITNRKLAEEKLKESEERFKGIYENATIGIYRTTPQGKILMANPVMVNMLEFESFEELAESRDLSEEGFETQEMRKKFMAEMEKEGFINGYEMVLITKKGKKIFVRESARVYRDKNRKTLYYEGTVEDITEQKLAEQSLIESEKRFKALHNASFGGIAIHDKGIIKECNFGLTAISGYSYDELIGEDGVKLLIAEESRGTVMSNVNSKYEKPYEAIGLRKNGEKYPLRLEARMIPYEGKEMRVVEFRDITAQKKSEQSLIESEEKYRTLMENLLVGVFRSTIEGEVL